jgi:dynein heavy chain
LRGKSIKTTFVQSETLTKKDNELNGPSMMSHIKNKNDDITNFISAKSTGIKLDDKDWMNDVNVLLSIKKDLEDIDAGLEDK